MKREHLKSNMEMVREDIESTLANIQSIKGIQHRNYVETLLLANQVLEASMMAISHIEDDPILKAALRTAVQQNMAGILSLYHTQSGFGNDDMEGLLADGDRLIANFKSSASAAVQASRSGYSIKE